MASFSDPSKNSERSKKTQERKEHTMVYTQLMLATESTLFHFKTNKMTLDSRYLSRATQFIYAPF